MKPDTAAAWFKRIRAMVEACDRADTDHKFDAMRTIEESAQNVEVRSGWYEPLRPMGAPIEYRIALSPHVRIVGELDEHGKPMSARMIGPATYLWGHEGVQAFLLRFAAHFYFGG